MTKRALLTGVTGFIGGALATRLVAEGWRVDAVVRASSDTAAIAVHPALGLHVHDGETASLVDLLDRTRPDIVFHLASLYLADHRPDQLEPLIESNILFPARLAEAMALTGVTRMVNTGTAWQHFPGPDYLPVNLYAATKQALDDLLAYYTDARGLSVITLKLFDTYGSGDKRRKLIRILCDAANQGETLDLSPGDQILDLTHVDDVVAAFIVAADLLLTDTIQRHDSYFVSGERHTVKELVAMVSRALGRPCLTRFGGRPYRPREVMTPVVPGPRQVLPGWTRQRDLLASLPRLDG